MEQKFYSLSILAPSCAPKNKTSAPVALELIPADLIKCSKQGGGKKCHESLTPRCQHILSLPDNEFGDGGKGEFTQGYQIGQREQGRRQFHWFVWDFYLGYGR